VDSSFPAEREEGAMDDEPEPDPGQDQEREVAEPKIDGPDLVRIGLFFYGAMLAVALIWRVGFYGESILYASPEAARRGVALTSDLIIGIVAGAAVVGVSHVFTNLTKWGEDLARGLAESIGPVALPNLLLLALASGMGEEALFRGALQPRVGLVWASLLFACVHFVPRSEFLPWTVFALLAGLLFGGLFLWTGNLVAPVVAHVVVNGVNLPLLVRRYGVTGEPPAAD
jgi:membrane protease YdiL (CAAX protease family)